MIHSRHDIVQVNSPMRLLEGIVFAWCHESVMVSFQHNEVLLPNSAWSFEVVSKRAQLVPVDIDLKDEQRWMFHRLEYRIAYLSEPAWQRMDQALQAFRGTDIFLFHVAEWAAVKRETFSRFLNHQGIYWRKNKQQENRHENSKRNRQGDLSSGMDVGNRASLPR